MADLVSIVIPAFNQLECCRQCVTSIQLNTDHPYKLILVDNGSTDGVAEYFDSVPDACVVHTGANLGFPTGVNRGLEYAEGHVLLLNSDTIVPSGWLSRLVNALTRDASHGAVGPVSNCVSGEQQIQAPPISAMEDIETLSADLAQRNAGRVRNVQRLVGFCLLIRNEAFQKVGLLDETYGIGNFEDDDYCLRILQKGYRCCIADDCFVFHYGSRTFAALGYSGEKYNDLCSENQRRFIEKWSDAAGEIDARRQASLRLKDEAMAVFNGGSDVNAVRLLVEAIKIYPSAAENYTVLGRVLWRMGQYEKAIEYMDTATKLAPDSAEALAALRDATALYNGEPCSESVLMKGDG